MNEKKNRPGPAEEPETDGPQGTGAGETPQGETPAAEEAPAEEPAEEVPETEPDPLEELKARVEELEKQLTGEKDKYLRLLAEYDNFRKRSARERDNIYADVKADTLLKLLPVYDSLDRALQHPTADEAYRKGVEMTMNQFMEALKALGVTPIEAVGAAFDPKLHNAVMHTEDPQRGEQEIVQELQKGFKMGDRVIRFSMVQVAN